MVDIIAPRRGESVVDENGMPTTRFSHYLEDTADDVNENATDIATNATDIATNATDIATNATDIATGVTIHTAHLNDTTDAHDASAISNVAAGNIASTDVQAALNELDAIITSLNLGKVLQIVSFQDGDLATGTTLMPVDDSIPQITEGDEYMTLAFTPISATSKLVIDVKFVVGVNTSGRDVTCALFVGTTLDALAAVVGYSGSVTMKTLPLTHTMIAGVTTELIFRVRAGVKTAATLTFNGYGGVRRHGGVMASSIIITEYSV